MNSWKVSEKEDKFEIFAEVNELGDDLLISLWGGTVPHIGAIAIAQPQLSSKNSSKISVTNSVYTFLGHKEDVIAKAMSNDIAKELNRKVVIIAGMHWDNLKKEEIDKIIEICEKLKEKVLKKIKKRNKALGKGYYNSKN